MTRSRWLLRYLATLLLSLAVGLSFSGLPSPAAVPSPDIVTYFFHSASSDFLDSNAPVSSIAKFKVSPPLDPSGYKVIGLWSAAARAGSTQLLGILPLRLWAGVTNSKDKPVRFDFRAELLKNGAVIATGESLSNRQLGANAASAKQISIAFGGFQATALAVGDVLSLRVLAKESGKGKKSSTGQVVVYYDSASRASQFGISVPANSAPVANAGPDQTVFVGDTVTLNGAASSDADGDPLTYTWAFASRPGGSIAILSDPSAVNPTFQVDRPGNYTVRLTVNDGKVDSSADIVIVSTFNSRPVANAGPDQTTFVGRTVTLDGSASSDFDGDPLTYHWSFVSRPGGSTATLQNSTSTNPSFVVDKFGEYSLQLIVNDGFIDSVAATVKISTLNSAPVAKAGANQTALVGDLITLDGSGSTDVDGNALTYSWSMTSKPAESLAALESSFAVNPTFVIDKPGNYVIQLIVNDGSVDSVPSTVTISTTNSPPVANAGADQVVFIGDIVQLNGAGSTDVDGDLLGFAWSIVSKPQNSQATISNAFIVNPTFTVDEPGTYIAQLVVTDGTVNSKPGTVTISTQNRPPVANAGVAQTVAVQSTVQLDGTTSSDPDGDTLTFTWSLLSKPTESAAVLSNSQIAKPTFVADMPGSYVAQLTVNDGKLNSAPVTVAISTDDSAPIANAGPDQTVPTGSAVQLDGSGSNDPDGSSLFYTWSFTTIPQGSAATFSNPLIAKPTFLADKRGTYVGQLIVGDGTLVSAPDTVMITATNRSPTAQDDSAITAMNTAVIVNVLANDSDPDGDPLSVTGVGQPANGKAVANANNTVTYTPAAAFVGSDSFTYSISDGQGGTAGATVRITVNPISGCPAPVITSIDPLSGPVGTEVTISGTNLDCGNTRTLTLNGVTLIITSLTPTQIKTFIPIGAQDGAFTVTTDGGSVTQQQLAYDVVLSQDFQLNVLPPSAAVMQGGSTNYAIEVALSGATPFTGTATLSASGLPSGASAFFSPAVVTAGQKATLTVSTSAITPPGTSSFQLNATATIDAQISAKSASAQLQVLPSGTTALAGSVLDTDGNPISGVTIRIGSIPSKFEAVTNAAGSFLLLDPPVGTQLIFVDGQTVPNIKYPTIPINVTIAANTVNQLPFTPFLHAQKDQNFTLIDPTKDTIVTDPELPGVTLRIPAGTQIIGWDGQPNQKVSMRAVPVDRLPIPPPPSSVLFNIVYMFYFGKVGGGTPTQPVPFSAPNDLGMEPGEKAELWYFDESPIPGGAPNDWRMAGLGTVSADGTTIVSDPGVGIPKFCCGAAAYNKRLATHGQAPGQSPQPGAGQSGADPVDLSTGIFMLTETDMVIPGRIPMVVTRSYRSGDIAIGPFGRGTTMSYDDILPLTAPGVLTYVYRGSARTQFFLQGDGSYVNNTVPAFRGARITINPTTGIRTLRHRNGGAIDFDTGGLMLALRDRNGNQITISRSFGLKATRVTDPVNRSLNFTKSGDLETSLTDPLGRTVTYQYDGAARLIKVTRPDGSTTQYAYDNAHRMTSIIDGRGNVALKNSYDVNSRVCQQEQADGGKYKIYYVTTDRASFPENLQLLQQAAAGGPVSIPPCAATVSTAIVTATVVVDPMGRPTTYRFNGNGFLVSITNALGQTTSLQRDSVTNQLISATDPLARSTLWEYDTAGNVVRSTDPAGNVRRFEYEPVFNKLTTITDALGQISSFEYDSKGNLTAMVDPEQNLKPIAQRLKTTLIYNSLGQLLTLRDVLGNVATFGYDANGNLITTTDPLGNTTRRTYDLASRLTVYVDPRGKTTRYGYDLLNRITQVVDTLSGFTDLAYDGNSNLFSITDARGSAVTYTYDAMDRPVARLDPLKRSESFAYDLNGNLIQTIDRKGQVSTYQYDTLNRRTGGSFADGTSLQYEFDTAGRMVRARDTTGGDLLFRYDSLDRLVASTTPLGMLTYAYDRLGRRTSMTAAGQPPETYTYDANSQLRQVTRGLQSVTIDYDALRRRTKTALPNGASTEYFYDNASRVVEQIYKSAAGSLGNLTYQYDAVGNRRGLGGSLAQTLLPDAVASAQYDAANQQLQFGDSAMTYDLAGNLTSVTNASGVTTFNWDARQRLTGLNGPGMTAAFVYDPLGRRRSREINTQTVQHFYDGPNLLVERSSATTSSYLGSLSIDQPWVRNDNEFYFADALGSIVGLTNGAGAITTRYSYEPFGRTSVQGTSTNTAQFTGRENDGTGLYYYRARYYSPTLHRFISPDPLEFRAGDLNLYVYVSNRPTGGRDPFGLMSKAIDLAQGIASQIVDKLREDTILEVPELEKLMNRIDFVNTWGKCLQSAAGQSTTLGAQTPGYLEGNLATHFLDMADCAGDAAKSTFIPLYDEIKPFFSSGQSGQTGGSSNQSSTTNQAPASPAPQCGASNAAYPCTYYDQMGNRYHMTGFRVYDQYCPTSGQQCTNRTVRY